MLKSYAVYEQICGDSRTKHSTGERGIWDWKDITRYTTWWTWLSDQPTWNSRCGIRIPGNLSCWIFLGSLAGTFHVARILIRCRRPLDHLGWMLSGGWVRINFPNRLSRNLLYMVQVSSRNSESSTPLGISRSFTWVSFSVVLPYLERRDTNYRLVGEILNVEGNIFCPSPVRCSKRLVELKEQIAYWGRIYSTEIIPPFADSVTLTRNLLFLSGTVEQRIILNVRFGCKCIMTGVQTDEWQPMIVTFYRMEFWNIIVWW